VSNRDLSETAFMGKITAGVTHEMKNVLAIIRESAGLMEDLLGLAKDDSFPAREKFLKILSKIGDQVTRGVNLSDALNQFAHGPDQPVATVDMNRLIDQLVFLCQRFALSKRLTLKYVPHDQPLLFRCEVLKVQMTIFRGIDLLLNVADPGAILTIRPTTQGDDKVAVEFLSEGNGIDNRNIPGSARESLWDPLVACAESVNAKVEAGLAGACLTIVFTRHDDQ
jgi:C4-dicarboxylate-specific signal transduction histidine kinase